MASLAGAPLERLQTSAGAHRAYRAGLEARLGLLPAAKLLIVSMGKGGSTSLFNWLWIGVSGNASGLTYSFCGGHPRNIHSACWLGKVVFLRDLPQSEMPRVLSGTGTLRVAVQREPMARLLSAWKSKFACNVQRWGTDVKERERMVPQLLKQARMKSSKRSCLTLEEFARALGHVQARVRGGGRFLGGDLRRMNNHY